MKTIILIIFCAYSYVANADCRTGVAPIKMILYTSDIPYGKNIDVDTPCDDFNRSAPIVFVVHGFIGKANQTQNYKLAKGLIERGFTVFAVDWADAACTTLPLIVEILVYGNAVNNAPKVGQLIANYVVSLIDKCQVPLNNMMFVGHSLGAHVCGFASKAIQRMGYGLVPRIYGADPAGPSFENKPCKNRLCDTDASTTIVLHTTTTLGITQLIGHIDLYFSDSSTRCLLLDIICQHFNALLYLGIVAETCTCRFPGVAILYPKVTKSIPPYPQENTTDCFVMDCMIFDLNKSLDNLKGKSFYMFDNSDTLCTQKNFSCQN